MKAKSEVFNMDCIEGMKKYPDNYFELAIVDPPYGIGYDTLIIGKNGYKKYKETNWDISIPKKEYWDELFRVSKNQIVWGGNYMIENLYSSPCWLIWDKMTEFKGAVFEMAWTSFKSPSKAFIFTRVAAYTNQIKIHPTQKPVKLYKWQLQNYAKEGDKIIDTHLGSGSSRIAAYDLGFEFTGFELDEDYFKASEKRFKQHTDQLTLF